MADEVLTPVHPVPPPATIEMASTATAALAVPTHAPPPATVAVTPRVSQALSAADQQLLPAAPRRRDTRRGRARRCQAKRQRGVDDLAEPEKHRRPVDDQSRSEQLDRCCRDGLAETVDGIRLGVRRIDDAGIQRSGVKGLGKLPPRGGRHGTRDLRFLSARLGPAP